MSEAQSIGAASAGGAHVRSAIARAAERTGVDFRYLLAQAKLESALDPGARARTSSAAGLYQFTRGTWLDTLDKHGASHGLSWAGDAISGGRVNPQMASQIMALRYDADASSLMAAELARDNGAQLATALGREPDPAELYLGHFLGIGGATTFLSALNRTPDASAAALMPKAAAANRPIFYEPGGAPRTVAGVMDLIRGKMSAAMEDSGGAWVEGSPAYGAPTSFEQAGWNFAGMSSQSPGGASAGASAGARAAPARPAMSETLRDAFGLAAADRSAAPAAVRSAYDKLARLGL